MNLIWLLSLILAALLGYYANWLQRRIVKLEKAYKKKREQAKKTPEEIDNEKSTLIDLDDPVVAARLEHEETMRRLNPHVYHDEDDQE